MRLGNQSRTIEGKAGWLTATPRPIRNVEVNSTGVLGPRPRLAPDRQARRARDCRCREQEHWQRYQGPDGLLVEIKFAVGERYPRGDPQQRPAEGVPAQPDPAH